MQQRGQRCPVNFDCGGQPQHVECDCGESAVLGLVPLEQRRWPGRVVLRRQEEGDGRINTLQCVATVKGKERGGPVCSCSSISRKGRLSCSKTVPFFSWNGGFGTGRSSRSSASKSEWFGWSAQTESERQPLGGRDSVWCSQNALRPLHLSLKEQPSRTANNHLGVGVGNGRSARDPERIPWS